MNTLFSLFIYMAVLGTASALKVTNNDPVVDLEENLGDGFGFFRKKQPPPPPPATAAPIFPLARTTGCGKADVAFIVDTSGSVNSAEWAQQSTFAKSLVGGLNLGTDAVHYSLSVFGDSAKTLVPMTSDVAQVNALPFADKDRRGWRVGGSTRMDKGFKNAGQILDQTARKDVAKIVVMITDGVATSVSGAKSEADALKKKGYTVMAILVGSGVSVKDVANYVSVPAMQVTSFDALQSALASVNAFIAKTLCDEAQLVASTPVVAAPIVVAPIAPVAPPVVVTPTTGCGKADVAFLVDTSGSVNSAEWAQQATFTKSLVGGLDLGPDAVHYSLSVFGTSAKTLVPMTSDVAQVNALPFADKDRRGWRVGGSTAMDTGFLNAGQILDKTARKVPKIVVMITDGVATSASRAKAQATALKSKGYTVMAILVGSGTSVKDVADYVSVPAMQVKSFDALQSALASVNAFIAKTLCDEAQLVASTPALNANVPATPKVPAVIEQIPAEIVEATAVPEPLMPLETPEPLKPSEPLPTAAPTPCPGTKTASPTMMPTDTPTNRPTASPTAVPTATPTVSPTLAPTAAPTAKPSMAPTAAPTAKPTRSPTDAPTARPTAAPTARPSRSPTDAPTARPTAAPTARPSVATRAPTQAVVMTSAPRRLGSAVTAAPVQTIDSVTPPAGPAYGTPPATDAGYGGLFPPPTTTNAGYGGLFPPPTTTTTDTGYGGLFPPPTTTNAGYGGLFPPPTTTTTDAGYGGLFPPPTTTNAGYGGLFPPPTTTTTTNAGYGGLFPPPTTTNAGYGGLFPPPTTTTTTNAGYGTTGR